MYATIVPAARRCVVDGSTALVGTGAANRCYVRAGRCRAVRTAVCIVRRTDVRQLHAAVDSACDENVHQMCELPNYGRVLVATEVMAL